jgi:riboflavin synthase
VQVQFPKNGAKDVAIGASVALNGTCLTVTAIASDQLYFDVIAETLRTTNLGTLQQGSQVNFERSARMGDEIGGHTVSGHVHSTAAITSAERHGDDVRLQFTLQDGAWSKYILPKGFVAVDGCSLTVGEVRTLPACTCAAAPGVDVTCLEAVTAAALALQNSWLEQLA